MESINALLERVYESIDNYESYKEAQGESYNIFQVLDISNMEVIMCRMLADMINPEGMHGCGDRFLRTFVRKVLDIPVGDDFFQSAKVIKEYLIPKSETGRKNRRIDIVIRAKNWFIPIEVKIRADDQMAQCYDYYHFAAKQMDPGKARLYYLTRNGTMPKECSMEADHGKENGTKAIGEDQVVKLSFKKGYLRMAETDGPL